MMLADAIKRANSSDPKVFKTALAQTRNFKGVSGAITIRPNREPIKSPLCLLVVKGGKYILKARVPVKMDCDRTASDILGHTMPYSPCCAALCVSSFLP
jgi:branched-chain amino acid transport system substrate-binding protein